MQADVLEGWASWQQHLKQSGIFTGGEAEICRHQRRRRQQLIIIRRKKPCSGCKALVLRFTVLICRGILFGTTDGKNIASTATASATQRFMQMRQKQHPAEEAVYIANKKSKKFHLKAVPPCRMRKTAFILRTEEAISLAIRPAAPASYK